MKVDVKKCPFVGRVGLYFHVSHSLSHYFRSSFAAWEWMLAAASAIAIKRAEDVGVKPVGCSNGFCWWRKKPDKQKGKGRE